MYGPDRSCKGAYDMFVQAAMNTSIEHPNIQSHVVGSPFVRGHLLRGK